MTDTDAIESKPAPSRRPWFQFSLRTLLLAMLVFGCCLGWLVDKRRKSQEAWRAIRTLEPNLHVSLDTALGKRSMGNWFEQKLGIDLPSEPKAACIFGPHLPEDTITNLAQIKSLESITTLGEVPVSDEMIAPLSKLTLTSFGMSSPNFNGSGLRYLSNKNTIKTLNFALSTGLTEQGLTALVDFSNLETLNLHNAVLSDVMMRPVGQSPKLMYLTLTSTAIGNEGLSHLRNMRSLRHLEIKNTLITDEGLEHLATISTLGLVELASTNVTPQGVAKLRSLRPDMVILDH